MPESSKKAEQTPTRLDQFEQGSKILLPFLIPITIAVIGLVGNEFVNARQNAVENKKIDLEYVKIARDTLVNVKPDTDPRIVGWAYQTLFKLSPITVDANIVAEISNKRAPLPAAKRHFEIKDVPESALDDLIRELEASGATDIQKIKQGDKYTVRATMAR